MDKTVILTRHGKASDHVTFSKDIDRVLTSRGVNDGYKVASCLMEYNIAPGIIITSPAARASHTALIIARAMQINPGHVRISDNLYHCSSELFLDHIYSLDNALDCALIVAHNPGISDFAYELTRGEISFLPTTGTAIISYATNSWEEVGLKKPSGVKIIKPRDL